MAQQMFAAKYYFDYGEFNGRPVKINCLTALAYCVILGSIAYFVPLTGSDLMQWADAAGQGMPGSILFASMALLFSMLSFHVVVIVVLGWMLTNPPRYLQGKFPARMSIFAAITVLSRWCIIWLYSNFLFTLKSFLSKSDPNSRMDLFSWIISEIGDHNFKDLHGFNCYLALPELLATVWILVGALVDDSPAVWWRNLFALYVWGDDAPKGIGKVAVSDKSQV